MTTIRQFRGLPIEQIAHSDLTDMPDTVGTNSDHDARYYTEAEIDTMLSDGTIDHLNLSNIGVNTHVQIDTHIASTLNPHSVTFTQVGAIQDAIDTVNDTHIDWGLGANQVSTTDMTEGTNLYFTNERVDDRVAALIQNGTGITWTYVDAANTLTANCDLTWAELDKTVSDIADIATKSHTSLSDIGTNTHAQIDTHIADSSDPHGATLTQTNIVTSGSITGGDTLTIVTGDHGAAATDEVVNVCYGTEDPPAANTTAIGSLFIKYTA